jgi:hypothetical protein
MVPTRSIKPKRYQPIGGCHVGQAGQSPGQMGQNHLNSNFQIPVSMQNW